MKSVFISYVRENSADVDRLAKTLKAYDLAVWIDRNEIKPGTRWADAIRQAIRQGAFFIACFSREYFARSKTYMNEELTLAIDELRQRATDQAWFIPVLLSECEIPDRTIGGGETLRSLQHVALYQGWDEGLARILSILQPDLGVVHELETQLKDKSARVRIAATDRLAAMRGTATNALPTLIAILNDENVTVQRAVVNALTEIAGPTEEVVEELLKLITYADRSTNRDVIYAIHAANDSLAGSGVAAIDPMIKAIERYPAFEQAVSRVLTDIRDIKSIETLAGLLLHKHPEIRGSAALAIGHNTFDPERGYPEEYVGTSFAFEERFKPDRPSAPIKKSLIRALQDDSPFVRSHAAEAIGLMGAHAADLRPDLVRALSDPEVVVRRRAAFALGEIGDPPVDALPALVGMLPSPEAAFALGRMGERAKASVPVMLDHLRRAANAFESSTMIVALGRIGDTNAVATLLGFLDGSAERAVRVAAASSLSHFPPTEKIRRSLEKIVCDPAMDEDILFSAATTLGRFDPSKAVPVLVPYLRHQFLFTRMASADALGRIGSVASGVVQDLIDALSTAGGSEFNILRALERIGTPQALEAVRGFKGRSMKSAD